MSNSRRLSQHVCDYALKIHFFFCVVLLLFFLLDLWFGINGKDWADKIAAPWLKNNLDVIDFWVDTGIEPEVGGSSPVVSPNGQPNVCWIIRWSSKEDRDLGFAALKRNEEWQEIWSKHPNENSYLHKNVRFMKAIG